MYATTEWSEHAIRRARQRAVPLDVVERVIRFGRVLRQPGGVMAYFVGRRDIERAKKRGIDLTMANSVAVVMRDDFVVTVIRSADLARLRRHNLPR